MEQTESYNLLSSVGKKVLRPGGAQLTKRLLENLNISPADEVVEFAPGLGFTAAIALSKHPKSYIGIERDAASVTQLEQAFSGKNCSFMVADIINCELPNESATKVYGEAMLTMHAENKKVEIIAEANRILKPGGFYGIHELGLNAETLSAAASALIKKELAQVSHVNARPLSVSEWSNLLEQQGFKIIAVETSEMLLLEPERMLADEGLLNFIKIVFNVVTNSKVRKRVLALRSTFKKYRKSLIAVLIVAQKI